MAIVTLSTIDRLTKPTSLSIGADDAVLEADVTALATALQAVIRGATLRQVISIPNVVAVGSEVPPADEEANRKNLWLFRSQDTVNGKIFTNRIGTANNTALPSPTTDFLDLTAGLGLALKTAWDDVYVSPYGNAGVLLTVQQGNGSGN